MNRIILTTLHGLGAILTRLPRRVTWLMGQALGLMILYLAPIRKKVARANIAKAFPELSAKEQRKILRRCYRHFGVATLDILFIPNWSHRLHAVATLGAAGPLDAARKDGQGLILASGHLGNWEMNILALGKWGYPLVPVVKSQKGLGELLAQSIRDASGCDTIDRKAPIRQMLRLLKQGNFLGLASDQEALGKGTWVNFFGQGSSRFKGVATFHLSSGVPIYFVRCLLGADMRYHIDFVEVETGALTGDREADITTLTQRVMNLLEAEVRQHPEQYFWFHRLWKSRRQPA